jgi:hypothetical protein
MDKPTASTTSVLRVINERAVYEQIRLNGPVSRPEVAKATGLSKPTISLALVDLERVGLVRTAGAQCDRADRSGRRPRAGAGRDGRDRPGGPDPAGGDMLESMTPLSPPPIQVSTLSHEAVVLGALAIGLSQARETVFNRAVAEPAVG